MDDALRAEPREVVAVMVGWHVLRYLEYTMQANPAALGQQVASYERLAKWWLPAG